MWTRKHECAIVEAMAMRLLEGTVAATEAIGEEGHCSVDGCDLSTLLADLDGQRARVVFGTVEAFDARDAEPVLDDLSLTDDVSALLGPLGLDIMSDGHDVTLTIPPDKARALALAILGRF